LCKPIYLYLLIEVCSARGFVDVPVCRGNCIEFGYHFSGWYLWALLPGRYIGLYVAYVPNDLWYRLDRHKRRCCKICGGGANRCNCRRHISADASGECH